jgi:predicted molibdopterin-dependent oxidoreductase YjgC
MEETDVIFLWGANPRENHPIIYHHVLKGIHHGAKLYAVDPRRTPSAQWADVWMGLNVGTDIALANAMARVIIHEGLVREDFVAAATTGFAAYRDAVESYSLEFAEQVTGVPADVIREAAVTYATAPRAIICWTLGITEHHNAVDNVLALINLSLITGHVGRYGSGLSPLRGQNNVQGGGDMGALPNKLVGFQNPLDPATKARFEAAWGVALPDKLGWNITEMFEAMERKALTGLYVIGENPAQSEADQHRSRALLEGLEHLVVQDIFLTKTAELADVVLPATASWAEAEGTVTNSERRVQRVRAALEPPAGARDELRIVSAIARRLGADWGEPSAEQVWNEVRQLAPHMFGGMSYARLEQLGGIQWPCPDESHPGTLFLHGRLWETPRGGPPAPISVVQYEPPVELPDAQYPFQLTTGRRLDEYNTGVQSEGYASPIRQPGALGMAPEDAARLGLADGDPVRVASRRGRIVVPVRVEPALRPGLVFMAIHGQEDARVNLLTIDATDPKSGTAEFKACAVSVEPVAAGAAAGAGGGSA